MKFKESWLVFYTDLQQSGPCPEMDIHFWALMIKTYSSGWIDGIRTNRSVVDSLHLLIDFSHHRITEPDWLPDETWLPKKEQNDTSVVRTSSGGNYPKSN